MPTLPPGLPNKEAIAQDTISTATSNYGLAERDLKIAEATDKVSSTFGDGPTQSNTPLDVPGSLVPTETDGSELKVRLTSNVDSKEVFFEVMPELSETRSVSYSEFSPLHHPGDILKYEKTSSREWTLSGRLISRTPEEASWTLEILNTIRSWAMPYYGVGTGSHPLTSKLLGAPPPILTLNAYGRQVVGPVKVVMTSYDWSWSTEVDYIPTELTTPQILPVILNISMNLRESWSPREYSSFDLLSYRDGNMGAAFGGSNTSQQSTSGTQITSVNPDTVDRSQVRAALQTDLNAANTDKAIQQQTIQTVSGTNRVGAPSHSYKPGPPQPPSGTYRVGAPGRGGK